MGEERNSILLPGGEFGNYRVVRLLGKGGMGEVYLVEDSARGKFAVKVLAPSACGGSRDLIDRFVREAEFAMRMSHPNLVEVYDAGIDPDTGLFGEVQSIEQWNTCREVRCAICFRRMWRCRFRA